MEDGCGVQGPRRAVLGPRMRCSDPALKPMSRAGQGVGTGAQVRPGVPFRKILLCFGLVFGLTW